MTKPVCLTSSKHHFITVFSIVGLPEAVSVAVLVGNTQIERLQPYSQNYLKRSYLILRYNIFTFMSGESQGCNSVSSKLETIRCQLSSSAVYICL